MKIRQKIAALSLIILTGTTGCQTMTTSQRSATVDLAPTGRSGYVEFVTRQQSAAIPIYRMDEKRNLALVGVIGFKEGEQYHPKPEETEVPITETLRVVVPPGHQTFVIQGQGAIVDVLVTEGKVTTVEIDYTLVEFGEKYELYRVNTVGATLRMGPLQRGQKVATLAR